MGNGSSANKTKILENLILVGDSVLDDFYWCDDQKNDVEHQLLNTFNSTEDHINITNLALDESTILELLNGKKPNPLYVNARKKNGLEPYHIDIKDGKVYPLKILTRLISDETIYVPPTKEDIASQSFIKTPRKDKKDKNEKDLKKSIMRPIVVLSIGGNDLRKNLSFGKPNLIIGALEENEFKPNLEKIIKFLTNNLHLDVIIVIYYEPHESFFETELHFARDDLIMVMDWFGKQIMRLAEEYKLPVLDLSRTINPFDRTHYGGTTTQPSNKSGQFIVDLIIHILQNFDFESNDRKSIMYYGIKSSQNGIECIGCNKNARSDYLDNLKRLSPEQDMTGGDMDLLADLFSDNHGQKDGNVDDMDGLFGDEQPQNIFKFFDKSDNKENEDNTLGSIDNIQTRERTSLFNDENESKIQQLLNRNSNSHHSKREISVPTISENNNNGNDSNNNNDDIKNDKTNEINNANNDNNIINQNKNTDQTNDQPILENDFSGGGRGRANNIHTKQLKKSIDGEWNEPMATRTRIGYSKETELD